MLNPGASFMKPMVVSTETCTKRKVVCVTIRKLSMRLSANLSLKKLTIRTSFSKVLFKSLKLQKSTFLSFCLYLSPKLLQIEVYRPLQEEETLYDYHTCYIKF